MSANPESTSRELAYQINDCNPRFVLAAEEQLGVAIEGERLAKSSSPSIFTFHPLDPLSLRQRTIENRELWQPQTFNSWTQLLAPIETGKSFQWDT